ncbi:unnamed protein product [Pedinophyceae sp. YPF-701]|nr:unnamed protein product [Pedinophyceae sp. YPF-701]
MHRRHANWTSLPSFARFGPFSFATSGSVAPAHVLEGTSMRSLKRLVSHTVGAGGDSYVGRHPRQVPFMVMAVTTAGALAVAAASLWRAQKLEDALVTKTGGEK